MNPCTAFVCWPVDVANLSTGKAKYARYAIECPSINNKRGRVMSLTPDNLSVMTDNHVPEPDLDALKSAIAGTLIERMQIQITELGAQRTVATMPVAGNTQPAGLLHGGASVALAETVGSLAAAQHAGEDRPVVGIEINATHHRAARSGTVTAVATPLHLGRTMASYEIVITDEAQKRICTVRLSCMILAHKP